jgi:hypothetical protein
VGASAIPSHYLNTGMLAQPRGQAFGLTIRQKVDNRVAFQINQDRPVTLPATPSLVWHSIGCADGTFASLAQSSTARTRGAGGGSAPRPALPTNRSNVSALIGMASLSARRMPASPPSASAQWF